MANETSKQFFRRSADRRYANRWIAGDGIDIGSGDDPLSKLTPYFPLLRSVRPFDLPDGDAMLMDGIPAATYDFVHSSHCLEHLVDPVLALENWIRICRPGGYLIITVPDEDLYEQGVWPSTFNPDHKWTFTIAKPSSWSPKSVNLFDLLHRFVDGIEIIKLELLDSGFQYGQIRLDQTQGALAESAIEFILRKKPPQQTDPASVGNLFALAVSLHAEQRHAEATALYREILKIQPDNVTSMNNLSLLTGRTEARALLRSAVALNPTYLDARINLGKSLLEAGDLTEAEICLREACRLAPTDPRAWLELATVLEAQNRDIEAVEALKPVAAAKDISIDDLMRMGGLLETCGQTQQSIACFQKVLAANPNRAEARIPLGFAQLATGDYHAGGKNITWIWRQVGLDQQARLFIDEQGQPTDLTGQTILLTADSGLGDAIQFVRYAIPLKAQGATVRVECQPALVRLFQNQTGIDFVTPIGVPPPKCDIRVPMHNLIAAFGTTLETIPGGRGYLVAAQDDVTRWAERLDTYPGLKAGLAWAGNPDHVRDKRRSIDPTLLRGLASIPGVTLVSLQKNAPAHDINLIDWSGELTDLSTTAALLTALDLIITVDTAVAHLAGALGRPVWLLNRFDSCWRWLKDRTDSPWYPTMRQFRQARPGDWRPVIADLIEALSERASGQPHRTALPENNRPGPPSGHQTEEHNLESIGLY